MNFTDLPAPKRTHRLVMIAQWVPVDPGMECDQKCEQDQDIEEISFCLVCGRWLCQECFGYEVVWVPDPKTGEKFLSCQECAKLTNEERLLVMGFRSSLDPH